VSGAQQVPRGESLSPPFLLGFRRALYRGAGYTRAEVRRPLIGVANSWGEISPATKHLNVLTDRVKAGIWAAGGTPVEFVLSGLCDGTCAAAPGANRYNLPWRDIAVSYLEAVANANMFDGIVFVGVCDEVVPAHLLAALRLDLPALLVLGGTMEAGVAPSPSVSGSPTAAGAAAFSPAPTGAREAAGERSVWAGDMTGAFAAWQDGSLGEDDYLALEDVCCLGAGACGVMGTGNTMQVFAEACGLAMPGTAIAPGGSIELEHLASVAGQRAVALVHEDLRPSAVFTQGALQNAVRAVVAVGGSTCAVLHALAIAAEANLALGLDDFDRLSGSTPLVADVLPSGRHSVADLHRAGGVSALLKSLAPLLDLDTRSVTGLRLGDHLAAVAPGAADVIRPLDDPLHVQGGIVVLRGSLAPEGAVFKQSGSAVRRFGGPARVFESEDKAGEAILNGAITGGEVIVVRGCGPKGAPGMPCLYGSVWLLKSRGLDDKVALVTDGRLSGTIRGLAVAHVSPESGVGGPLAAVRDGDRIDIDIDARRIDLDIDGAEIAARLASEAAASRAAAATTEAPAPGASPLAAVSGANDAVRGALAQYRSLVGPTHLGAVVGHQPTPEEESHG
jgi:dihydroxy-acid dehydratase